MTHDNLIKAMDSLFKGEDKLHALKSVVDFYVQKQNPELVDINRLITLVKEVRKTELNYLFKVGLFVHHYKQLTLTKIVEILHKEELEISLNIFSKISSKNCEDETKALECAEYKKAKITYIMNYIDKQECKDDWRKTNFKKYFPFFTEEQIIKYLICIYEKDPKKDFLYACDILKKSKLVNARKLSIYATLCKLMKKKEDYSGLYDHIMEICIQSEAQFTRDADIILKELGDVEHKYVLAERIIDLYIKKKNPTAIDCNSLETYIKHCRDVYLFDVKKFLKNYKAFPLSRIVGIFKPKPEICKVIIAAIFSDKGLEATYHALDCEDYKKTHIEPIVEKIDHCDKKTRIKFFKEYFPCFTEEQIIKCLNSIYINNSTREFWDMCDLMVKSNTIPPDKLLFIFIEFCKFDSKNLCAQMYSYIKEELKKTEHTPLILSDFIILQYELYKDTNLQEYFKDLDELNGAKKYSRAILEKLALIAYVDKKEEVFAYLKTKNITYNNQRHKDLWKGMIELYISGYIELPELLEEYNNFEGWNAVTDGEGLSLLYYVMTKRKTLEIIGGNNNHIYDINTLKRMLELAQHLAIHAKPMDPSLTGTNTKLFYDLLTKNNFLSQLVCNEDEDEDEKVRDILKVYSEFLDGLLDQQVNLQEHLPEKLKGFVVSGTIIPVGLSAFSAPSGRSSEQVDNASMLHSAASWDGSQDEKGKEKSDAPTCANVSEGQPPIYRPIEPTPSVETNNTIENRDQQGIASPISAINKKELLKKLLRTSITAGAAGTVGWFGYHYINNHDVSLVNKIGIGTATFLAGYLTHSMISSKQNYLTHAKRLLSAGATASVGLAGYEYLKSNNSAPIYTIGVGAGALATGWMTYLLTNKMYPDNAHRSQ